ncbi:hypothetical protein AX774_g2640 [Zancudomyces culisetae]|uniref:Uncharacterized protein n=1 Tax=Zancudomyces culisetae TaxID=1213189 RepID=A0A1R1PSF5_ZANCU|nr:hypothetical protein AX774_g2640 [Zancudomyces culisetae]|eukprot:OMH83859.1 hypothetical protein AX774_g2640 [Zancudomyces culisetae]
MRKKKASRKADITKKLNILGPEEFVHTRTLLENPLTITRVDPDTFQQYKNTIAFYSESHNEEHRTFYRARVPNYIPTYYISEPNGAKFPEDNTWTNHNTPYSNGLRCESGNVAPINYTRLNSPSSIDGPLQKPKRTDSKLGSCNCIIL